MIETTAPGAERCGMHTAHFRVTCDLPAKHVKTGDDWHEATVTRSTTERGSTHSIESELTEVIRWAPKEFEIPRPEPA